MILGELRRDIGKNLRGLCEQHGVELVEGPAMPDQEAEERRQEQLSLEGIKALVYSHPWNTNQTLIEGMIRVTEWDEIKDLLLAE